MASRFRFRPPWYQGIATPDPEQYGGGTILLASEGRKISPQAIALAARMARTAGAGVHVLTVARIWGSALGLPHPGLKPTRSELQQQHDLIAETIAALKGKGVAADGEIVSSRSAARRIAREARRHRVGAIVMSADPPRHWLIADLLWSQEPYRVRRLADVPVYTVLDESQS
ncbi:MAG TPA: universal stress protein [Candidatus Binatia bacterium]|nr:universal stress protein [Candidatus Binatia bacterium]